MKELNSSEYFINRELSLLAFNERVLEQAEDQSIPVLERLKFLCIFSSNMDELFEIRVAGLKEQIKLGSIATGPDGLSPSQIYKAVGKISHELVERQYHLFNETLIPELLQHGICFLRRTHWNDVQKDWIKTFFINEVMPVLTPIGLDPAHPFPRVLNKTLNFALELEGKDAFGRNSGAAIVQAPRTLPRIIHLPKKISGCEYGFVFLSSILHAHVDELFSGMNVLGCYQFRVTRNSDLFIDDEEIKNLRLSLKGELPHRHFGNAVRLEVADNCSKQMSDFLLQQFDLNQDDLYQVNGQVNLVRLMQIPDIVDLPELKYPVFTPGLPTALAKQTDIFQAIRKSDMLLHHPYQAFTPVIEFIQQASRDPQVVAIKQTVYRTSPDSALMEALIYAAQQGKGVTVVVELLARFDEEANINWAGKLEEAGAHVVYGVVGYKAHAKMALVVRREEDGLRRYAHLGTGNYHPRTAKFYTDFGLFTCDEEICSDVNDVFSQLTGLGKASKLKHLWQAPFTLHSHLLKAINHETKIAQGGAPASIIAKMNSLLEPKVIQALYEASCAGVQIDLIVRGACALRPGIAKVSENIRVRSVVGRFLEHSRIYYFHNAGQEDIYLASADWMDRNFFRRIEICFPILNPRLKKRIINEGLKPYLKDNCQAWEMNAKGIYSRKKTLKANPHSAQQHLLSTLAES